MKHDTSEDVNKAGDLAVSRSAIEQDAFKHCDRFLLWPNAYTDEDGSEVVVLCVLHRRWVSIDRLAGALNVVEPA